MPQLQILARRDRGELACFTGKPKSCQRLRYGLKQADAHLCRPQRALRRAAAGQVFCGHRPVCTISYRCLLACHPRSTVATAAINWLPARPAVPASPSESETSESLDSASSSTSSTSLPSSSARSMLAVTSFLFACIGERELGTSSPTYLSSTPNSRIVDPHPWGDPKTKHPKQKIQIHLLRFTPPVVPPKDHSRVIY